MEISFHAPCGVQGPHKSRRVVVTKPMKIIHRASLWPVRGGKHSEAWNLQLCSVFKVDSAFKVDIAVPKNSVEPHIQPRFRKRVLYDGALCGVP